MPSARMVWSPTRALFRLMTSSPASTRMSSAASRAARVISAKLADVSTTMYAHRSRRTLMIRARSARPIRSAELGSVGAARTSSPLGSWRRSRFSSRVPSSRSPAWTASAMVWVGWQLQHEGHVAELEVGVDEDDGLDGPLGQGHGQVDGHDRLAGAALGAEDRHDPAPGSEAAGPWTAANVGAGRRAITRAEARDTESRSSLSSAVTATTSSTPARSASGGPRRSIRRRP